MNKRVFGMAPGGRMSLDRAANRRRNIWQNQQVRQPQWDRQGRPREKGRRGNPEADGNG